MGQYEVFRQQTSQWLEDNCPSEMRRVTSDETDMVWSGRTLRFKSAPQKLWFERMKAKGWFAPDWPVKYGGGGLEPRKLQILEQEMRRLSCRQPQINLGIWMLGPVLLEHGTDQQKTTHLIDMTQGKIRWCQGFSEPNSGSDLASLQTSAINDGEDYIVTGSKIWTSYAAESDWMYCLVRTDKSAGKHLGISMLLIDLKSPGVSIKNIELISGSSHFCEVFFDQVRVPRSNRLGQENAGWAIAKQLMFFERQAIAKLGDEGQTPYKPAEMAKKYQLAEGQRIQPDSLRNQVAQAEMDDRVFQLTLKRTTDEAKMGQDISGVSSIFKYVGTEMEKRKTELLRQCLGTQSLGWEGTGFDEDELSVGRSWLEAKALSIGGGTSEVQLNIIAKRILGLPD